MGYGDASCFGSKDIRTLRIYRMAKESLCMGKKLSDIDHVPVFWPNNAETRGDMLDYSIEVEHYDTHLGRILAHLEKAGQLDNALIVATSDHGMPVWSRRGV